MTGDLVPTNGRKAMTGQLAAHHHGLQITERQERVAAAVLAHVTYREIANREGCSVTTVHNDVAAVKEYWRVRASEHYDAVVAAEVAKLDALEATYAGAYDGDLGATAVLLKVMDRRARLLGLDQPTRVEVAVEDTEAKRERAAAILASVDELAARRAG